MTSQKDPVCGMSLTLRKDTRLNWSSVRAMKQKIVRIAKLRLSHQIFQDPCQEIAKPTVSCQRRRRCRVSFNPGMSRLR
jgi:hypothetical protein